MARSVYRRERGISLVEALVALAVMAFGILGIVGIQMTLRSTGDLSKQRAEAVRIAQGAVESSRGFSVLDTTPGLNAYQDIADAAAAEVAGTDTNTTFSLAVGVTDHFSDATALRTKTMETAVTWPDRAGVTQSVVLRTVVAAIAPEIAGALAVPARDPSASGGRGRNPAIPPGAVDQADGSSHFQPPGAPDGLRWVFDNTSGIITFICTSSDPASCVEVNARLLSGYVRFATGSTQPTPAQAEAPPSPAMAVQVSVDVTLPTPAATIACYVTPIPVSYVAYYCAMPVTSDGNPRWSGRSLVGGLPLATTIGEVSASLYRVCRYTPVRDCQPTVGSTIWGASNETASCTGTSPTPSRLMTNTDHPLDYGAPAPDASNHGVAGPLTNQNFLVIRAGDGSTAFECPADDTGTPFVNGNTWRHQPGN